jgi:hypothetical protein
VRLATYFDSAIFATRLQPQYSQSLRDNHFLLPIVWWWDTLEKLEAFKSSNASGALVRRHAADRPVKNLGGSAMMKRTGLFWIDNMPLMKKVVVAELEGPARVNEQVANYKLLLKTLTLFRKKLPEMLISSHLTTTIFCPERICFEMIDANRPRRWPLPSMTMGVEEKVAMLKSKGAQSG